MKKTGIFFVIAAIGAVVLTLYNKNKQNPAVLVAVQLLTAGVARLGASLQKALLIKGLLALSAVTSVSALCKKLS